MERHGGEGRIQGPCDGLHDSGRQGNTSSGSTQMQTAALALILGAALSLLSLAPP